MKNSIWIAAVMLSLTACTNKGGTGFSIKGELQGLADNKNVYILTTNYGLGKTDTLGKAISKDGKFDLSGSVSTPEYAALVIEGGQGYGEMMLENTEIGIKGSADSLFALKITGSKTQDEFINAEAGLKKHTDQLMAIQQKAMMMGQSPNPEAMKLLQDEYAEVTNQLQQEVRDYATEYPNSFVSPVLLLNAVNQETDPALLQPIYDKFSNEVKQSSTAKFIKQVLEKSSATAIGTVAPNLKGQTPEGKELSLNDVKGKVTLIDFWASWCGPCRVENPNVVKLYNIYHKEGLEIFGVSLDKAAEPWKKAIADDKLMWHHISDLKFWDSPLAKLYNVESIPATFLLDKQGVIVAKNLRGAELEKKIAELLAK